MKKVTEKVSVASFVALSLIFLLVSLLTYLNVIPMQITSDGVFAVDWVVVVILLILGVIWVLLAVYILWNNFAFRNALRYVTLYSDRASSTKATSRVIKRLAVSAAEQVDGVKIKKISMSSNDHLGLNLKLVVDVRNDDVAYSIDTLRYLLADKYREVLGLEFALIDFQVKRIKSKHSGDIGRAQAQAQEMQQKRQACSSSFCHNESSVDEVGDAVSNPAVTEVGVGKD
jgi:hypothetical protein